MKWSPDLASDILEQVSHFVGLSAPEDGQFVWINAAGMRLFRISQKALDQGISLKGLFREAPVEFVTYCNNLKRNRHDEFSGVFEFMTTHMDAFWGLLRCEPLTYHGRQFHLVTIIEVKNINLLNAETDKEKERFRVLFENATVGMLVTDDKGVIVTLNRFAEKQFGFQRGELIGRSVESLIPDQLRMKHEGLRTDFMKHPQHRPMGIGLDLFGKKKDGTVFPVEISLSHYLFGGQTFVIAFINDITIRKQAQENMQRQKEAAEKYSEEVKRLNEALERRVEERTTVLRETLHQLEKSKEELEVALEKEKELSDLKSRFVSMASHEFRTPLSTILSSASLIERYRTDEEQEKRQRHIQRIKDNVKNLNDILEDFLSLGKLDEGLIKPSQEPVDVQTFISAVLHDMDELKKDGQQIRYRHSGEEQFPTDKYLLKNILINLLSNAIKFSGDNGKIDVRSSVSENAFRISVRDHGIGISSDDQEHLFDRFFRGKNALNIKGTGLGLFIVSKYLQLLNGTITCRSKLNEGTEFTVIIHPINHQSHENHIAH
jgi:PAS domain S-box-containing protein